MNIKLKDIVPAPWNPRKEITPESDEELAADIKENGLINPITVWKNDDGAWVCIAGNRRLAALRAVHSDDNIVLPNDHYTVFVGKEDEAKALTFRENHHRLNLSPLGEAAQVAQFIADGLSHKDAARALGITVAVARRREKLNALADEWKERVDSVDLDALEKIACYTMEVQKRVFKKCGAYAKKWSDMRYTFDNETRDLDSAKFDTKPCRECLKRTGVEGDLFGVCDGDLGRCQDCKCFAKNMKAYEDEAIANSTKGADEVVRVDLSWQMPSESETKGKRDKKHPCAYVHVQSDGEILVRWGESKRAKEEAAKREREASEEKRAEESKKRARIMNITDKLEEALNADVVEAAIGKILEEADLDENVVGYIAEAVAYQMTNYTTDEEWANAVRTFKFVSDTLDDDERKTLLDEYPETDGEEEV